MATSSKKSFKRLLDNRDELINDSSNTDSELPRIEDNTPLVELELNKMDELKKQEQEQQETPITPTIKKHQEHKTKVKNNIAKKIDRPKRDIQVNTRITKEQYDKFYKDACDNNYKSVSDYIYYLLTKDSKW